MFRFSDSGTLGLAHLCVWKYKVHPLKDETPLHPEKAKKKEKEKEKAKEKEKEKEKAKEKEKVFQNVAVRHIRM